MARQRPVQVGNVRPMSGGGGVTLPPEEEDRFTIPGPDREPTPDPIQAFIENLGETVLGGAPGTFAPGGPGFIPPQIFSPRSPSTTSIAPAYLTSRRPSSAGGERMARERANYQPAEIMSTGPDMTFAEYAGLFGGGGGGAARPDFSAYRAALTDQAQQINAQIQAMYNALGEEAAANVGRIQDIYGGASTGIGDVYGSAIGNVEGAYGTAQQQAADQLARLGIEAAAPAVINPMALSQAEAVSQLQQGLAGGQAATERFGSAASGFGSQMAQVAQQQGTEMNAAILASLQNRLAESLAAEQTGGGGGGGGMSVRDQLALREAYNRDVLGELPLEERQFAFDVAQAAARPANEYDEWRRNKFFELTTPQNGQRPLFTPEEAQAYLDALDSYMSPG